jgi:hypothetical protein
MDEGLMEEGLMEERLMEDGLIIPGKEFKDCTEWVCDKPETYGEEEETLYG